jgi:hypothetical protein
VIDHKPCRAFHRSVEFILKRQFSRASINIRAVVRGELLHCLGSGVGKAYVVARRMQSGSDGLIAVSR